jgi:hypothetical protein
MIQSVWLPEMPMVCERRPWVRVRLARPHLFVVVVVHVGPAAGEVLRRNNWGRLGDYKGASMIILGVVLMLIGFIAKIPILWSVGIVVAVVGVILMLLGMAGREIGGRKHYY